MATAVLAAVSFSDSIQKTIDDIAEFVPRLIGAIVIFLIGLFIAKLIRKAIHKVLTRAQVDSLVDRSGLGGPLEKAGFADSGYFLATIVYIMLMLIVAQVTVAALGIDALKDLLDDFVAFIPKIFVAIIILFVTGAVANWVKDFIGGVTETQGWGNLATNVATGGVWLIGVFAALDQIQVAQDIVDTLFQAVVGSLALILVIKFGVGGIWAARDRFWPGVYDKLGAASSDQS
ncbi:MAG: hypothetical protein HKN26_12280 [Acidimicrobiales bacterium]|nr:hypothetical protein [Acidimicrobiales bacterium]